MAITRQGTVTTFTSHMGKAEMGTLLLTDVHGDIASLSVHPLILVPDWHYSQSRSQA